MYPLKTQLLYTHANTLATSEVQICFPAPHLNLHAKYSYIPNMPRGRISPGLPYIPERIKIRAVPEKNMGRGGGDGTFFEPATHKIGFSP